MDVHVSGDMRMRCDEMRCDAMRRDAMASDGMSDMWLFSVYVCCSVGDQYR